MSEIDKRIDMFLKDELTRKERNILICDLWREGLNGAQIAEKMQITRNSVLGTIHRERNKGEDVEPRRGEFIPKPPRPIAVKKKEKKAKKIVIKLNPPVVKIEEVFIKIDDTQTTDLMGLRYDSCRFIVEDGDVKTTKYCNKKIDKQSYCNHHYNICYYPSRHQLEKRRA